MANENLDKISKHYMFLKYIHGKHGESFSIADTCRRFKINPHASQVLLKNNIIDRVKNGVGYTYFWKSEVIPNVKMAEKLYDELLSITRNNNYTYKEEKPKAKKEPDFFGFLKSLKEKSGDVYSATRLASDFGLQGNAPSFLVKYGLLRKESSGGGMWKWYWLEDNFDKNLSGEIFEEYQKYSKNPKAYKFEGKAENPKRPKDELEVIPVTKKEIKDPVERCLEVLKVLHKESGNMVSIKKVCKEHNVDKNISTTFQDQGIVDKVRAKGSSFKYPWITNSEPTYELAEKLYGLHRGYYSTKVVTTNNKETTTKKYENNMKNKVENLEGIKSETYFSVLWGLITFHKMKHN